MDITAWFFPGYFVLAMAVSSLLPKTLGLSIAFCIGLSVLYPDASAAGFLTLFYFPFAILASFRD